MQYTREFVTSIRSAESQAASVRQTISFYHDIHNQHRLVLDSFNVSSQLKFFVNDSPLGMALHH